MRPLDLIKTAEELANSGKGKPRQSNLHRATSTTYYALFHELARCCANLMVGTARGGAAWPRVYRALDHNIAKGACSNVKAISSFPQPIQDFANMFVQMQEKRHRADYDPTEKAYKSAVLNDIAAAKAVINDFSTAPVQDRRAFAALVLFKTRKA